MTPGRTYLDPGNSSPILQVQDIVKKVSSQFSKFLANFLDIKNNV